MSPLTGAGSSELPRILWGDGHEDAVSSPTRAREASTEGESAWTVPRVGQVAIIGMTEGGKAALFGQLLGY